MPFATERGSFACVPKGRVSCPIPRPRTVSLSSLGRSAEKAVSLTTKLPSSSISNQAEQSCAAFSSSVIFLTSSKACTGIPLTPFPMYIALKPVTSVPCANNESQHPYKISIVYFEILYIHYSLSAPKETPAMMYLESMKYITNKGSTVSATPR